MAWNPWIQIEPEESSDDDVKALFKRTKNPMTGKISDLTRLTSLTPGVSGHLHDLCTAVYRNAEGLSAREKEVAALVTSSFIGCVH